MNCIDYNEVCERYSDLLRAKHVCVIGGGLVGVEISSEIAVRFPEKQVTLISRSRLLERCCEDAHTKCLALLQKLKVTSLYSCESV